MEYTKVENLEHLKKLCAKGEAQDFFIALGGGLCRSSKSIIYDGAKWNVFHEIDETEETLTDKGLLESTNIGTAISRGAFYKYNF